MATKEERRTSILVAAMKVIGEAGFEGATMEEIAKVAGVGKGTVYEYFDSKSSLFTEMTTFGAQQCIGGLRESLEAGETIMDKITNVSIYLAKFMGQHIDVVNASLPGRNFPEEMRIEIIKSWSVLHKTIEDKVRDALKTGEIRTTLDPEMVTAIIIGGLHQYNMKKIFLDRQLPEDIDHRAIAKIILTGLIW